MGRQGPRAPDPDDARSSTTRSATRCATSRSSASRSPSCAVDRYGRVDPDASRRRSRTGRSSSRSCTPTTRSARSSRSPRSPSGSAATAASCSTSTRSRRRRGSPLDLRSARRRPGRASPPTSSRARGASASLYIRHGTAHPRPAARRQPGAPPAGGHGGRGRRGGHGRRPTTSLRDDLPTTVARVRRLRERLQRARAGRPRASS